MRKGALLKCRPFLQKTKSFFGLVVLALGTQACHTSQAGNATSQAPFTLLEATSQNWTAGREEGGRGTDYFFKVALHANKVTFDSIWVNNQVLPAFVAKETITISNEPLTYAKGDTIIVRGSATTAAPAGAPPAGHAGAAVLRYHVGKKASYYTVEQIEKKADLNLPAKN